MILSFSDAAAEDLFHGRPTGRTRRFPPDMVKIALRKLDMLNAAPRIEDLRIPPGNRLEPLKGPLEGFFSIRINDQFRIVFRWTKGNAAAVRIEDHH